MQGVEVDSAGKGDEELDQPGAGARRGWGQGGGPGRWWQSQRAPVGQRAQVRAMLLVEVAVGFKGRGERVTGGVVAGEEGGRARSAW